MNNRTDQTSNGCGILSIIEPEPTGHKHSILIGKKCAYCMECGQILLEYKHKDEFKKWLHSFEELVNERQ